MPMILALKRMISPKSIAFIGGWEAETALRVTRKLGFAGRIYAVNPRREQLAGVACLASLADLPEAPDCAFVAVRREPAVEMVGALARMGTGGVVLYTSGFAELDEAGKKLQAELVAAAATMPVMGPNCYGFANALDRVSPWPDEHGLEPVEAGIAILTQSGNIACNFAMMKRHVPLAGLYTLGNQAVIGMAELVRALADDTRISAIGLHVEGVGDVARFAAAAEYARATHKPLVVLKTGRSEHGAKVAMSHTSSLAGADTLYNALFRRHGIARVHSVTALVETLKLLHHGGPLGGARMVSLSCSGGEAALVADMAMGRKVSFPPFDAATRESVAATLNDYVVVDNPLDYHTFIWNQRDKLAATFSAVMKGGFDVAMVILDIPTKPGMDATSWVVTADAWIGAAKATGARAITASSLHESMPENIAARLSAAGIAPMLGLDDAFAAVEAAAFIGASFSSHGRPPAMQPGRLDGAALKPLSEYQAKAMLAAAGLRVPDGVVCAPGDAAEAARRLGFPVAVKASSHSLAHKTELGGVALNLGDEAAVSAAAARMAAITDEVLVEKMVPGVVCELIVGVKADPQFGQALVIGAGGVLAEFLKDAATLILPTNRDEIEDALDRLAVGRLISGFRGKAGDRAGVIAAIEAIAAFAAAHSGALEELDVNPLMVLEERSGAVAADALVALRQG
jgi:acyl-CoA synthetase (NDP forming)